MLINNANTELHDEIIEERKTFKQQYDDALAANKEAADEIQKGHGEDGKQDTLKVDTEELKEMCLAESLFNPYLNEKLLDDYVKMKLKTDIFDTLSNTLFEYKDYDLTEAEIVEALEWFKNKFFSNEFDECVNIDESNTIVESVDPETLAKQLFDFYDEYFSYDIYDVIDNNTNADDLAEKINADILAGNISEYIDYLEDLLFEFDDDPDTTSKINSLISDLKSLSISEQPIMESLDADIYEWLDRNYASGNWKEKFKNYINRLKESSYNTTKLTKDLNVAIKKFAKQVGVKPQVFMSVIQED